MPVCVTRSKLPCESHKRFLNASIVPDAGLLIVGHAKDAASLYQILGCFTPNFAATLGLLHSIVHASDANPNEAL